MPTIPITLIISIAFSRMFDRLRRNGIKDGFTLPFFIRRTRALVIHLITIRPTIRTTMAMINVMPYFTISSYTVARMSWNFSMFLVIELV